MKRLTAPILSVILAALALPAAHGQPEKELQVHGLPRTKEIFIKDARAGVKETVTFLGIETVPVDPALSKQLNLPQETGLVIRTVIPDSPAAGVLEAYDILTKFEDQLLIESRQLAVLVRARKAGDEVTMTFIRSGKEQTAKVKLGQHEVPKFSERPGRIEQREFLGIDGPKHFTWQGMPPMPREEADRMLELIQMERQPAQMGMIQHREDGAARTTIVSLGHSNIVYSDDEGMLELKINDGRKDLTAKDKAGKVLFAGSINTDQERKGVPPGVLARLKNIENPDRFEYQTDQSFLPPPPEVAAPGSL
jgi:hypothetical protein